MDMNKLDPELATQIEEYCQSCFTSIDRGTWRILPRNVPVSKINRQFLKYKSELKPLYQAMDITVLNRSLYFKLYVVPEFHKLKPAEQIRTMTFIRDEYKSLLAEYSDLSTVLMNHNFVTTRGGRLASPAQLFHPNNIVFQILYEDQPVRFPAAEYCTAQWLDFLTKIGMNIHTSTAQIVNAAEKIEEKRKLYDSYEKAIKLFNYIVDIAPSLNTRIARDLFSELKDIKFAPATWDPRTQKEERDVLESFSAVVQPKDAYVTWMIRPKLHEDAKISYQWAAKLGIPQEPQLQTVLEHLVAITQADLDFSTDIDAVLTYLASECSLLGQRQQQIQNQVKLLQKQLTSMSSKKQKKASRKKNRKAIDDEDENNNNNGADEENLEVELSVDDMDTYVLEFSQKLNDTFKNLKCFKIDSTLSVSREQMFFKLAIDLRPYFLPVPEQLFPVYPLLKFIGVTEEPSLDQLVDVIDQIREKAKGKPLNVNQMQLCLKILKMITAKSSNSFIPNLWIPDLTQRLHPVTEIVYIDSSYLCQRIKMERLKILHSSISNKMAKKLGITPISQVIEEALKDGFQYNSKDHLFAKQAEATIQSKQFSEGIHRILYHQNALTELKNMKQIFGKLQELSQFHVYCVDTLQSKFTDIRTQTDVTLEPNGSLCVLDTSKKGIFFVDEFAKPQEIMASEINKFLGNPILDTIFLQAILASAPHMIHKTLTLLKVSELSGVNSAINANLLQQGVGDIFSESDQAQLRKNPICGYFADEVVVCVVEGKMLYGIITQQINPTSIERLAVYEVLIGPEVTWQISLPQIYKLKGTETSGDKYFSKFKPAQQVEQFLKLAMKDKEDSRKLALSRLKQVWADKKNSEVQGYLQHFEGLF